MDANPRASGVEIQVALEEFITPILKANGDNQQADPVSLTLIDAFVYVFIMYLLVSMKPSQECLQLGL